MVEGESRLAGSSQNNTAAVSHRQPDDKFTPASVVRKQEERGDKTQVRDKTEKGDKGAMTAESKGRKSQATTNARTPSDVHGDVRRETHRESINKQRSSLLKRPSTAQ